MGVMIKHGHDTDFFNLPSEELFPGCQHEKYKYPVGYYLTRIKATEPSLELPNRFLLKCLSWTALCFNPTINLGRAFEVALSTARINQSSFIILPDGQQYRYSNLKKSLQKYHKKWFKSFDRAHRIGIVHASAIGDYSYEVKRLPTNIRVLVHGHRHEPKISDEKIGNRVVYYVNEGSWGVDHPSFTYLDIIELNDSQAAMVIFERMKDGRDVEIFKDRYQFSILPQKEEFITSLKRHN